MRPRAIRRLSAGMRWIFWIGCGFVAIAGIQLYLLSAHTDVFFAWTVSPALTAAVMGGFYWTALVVSFLSARPASWANARVGVPGILLFLLLTLSATLIHIDRFHLHAPQTQTMLAAWAWLAIYIADPLALLVMVWFQLGAPGGDPPRRARLPDWYRVLLLVLGGLLLAAALALFVAPTHVAPSWAWALTPLTARAIGAWLAGMGVMLGQSAWEDDWERIRPATTGYAVFGLLQLVALARYYHEFRWDQPVAWLWVLAVLGIFFAGAYSVAAERAAPRDTLAPRL